MKKLFFILLAVTFAFGVSHAQGKKSYGAAKKALSTYSLDPTNSKGKLGEAVTEINQALQDAEMQADAEVWNKKGEIFNELATQIVTVNQFGIGSVDDLPKVDGNPAMIASEAYKMALQKAEKKYHTKDALKGLVGVEGNLNNLGFYDYEAQNYAEAFKAFKEVLAVHDILKENGVGDESSLAKEEDYNNQLYITGLSALNAGSVLDAKPMFMKLYDMQYDKPAIYEALYQIELKEREGEEGNKKFEEAYTYLQTGRTKYPDDVSLLFAEINHYLKLQQLEVLISKLQAAIQQEPNNVSLYTTTGSVYDNLHSRAAKEGDDAKAEEYFEKAKEYYEQALAKDESNFDATYSVGALYYNKAATMTQDLNTLAEDYSKEGIKKYEAKRNEVFAQFDKALPYFKRCERLNPNDVNTLIALKEIYAKKDDLEVSKVFKDRLENVQNGGTNEKSYFNQ